MFGFHREGGTNIADLEKAFVDALYLRQPSRELGEAMEAAVRQKKLNRAKVADYAEKVWGQGHCSGG